MSTAVLNTPTLVLNRNWLPIHTLPARVAIGLVARGSARIIDPVSYEMHDLYSWSDVSHLREIAEGTELRSESLLLAPLEVIVLTCYDGVGDRSVTFSRLNLYRRDNNTCQYCGCRPGTSELTIDHILPRSRGGTLCWENCTLACTSCNKKKANRTPGEARMRLKRAPKKPDWKSIQRIPSKPVWKSWQRFLSDAYWQQELKE
ncbi:MAG TPA: HNH endonuclease [Planctomycetes bacterium]|nr:HNH endonuclease [Planctomycetota bacterium]